MIGIIALYIAIVLLHIFAYMLKDQTKRPDPEIIIAGFIPILNVLTSFMCFLLISDDRKHIPAVLRKLRITSLDEYDQTDLDKVTKEYNEIVSKAKLQLTVQKNVIKTKASQKKLCAKLGLSMSDLNRLKELPPMAEEK